MVGKHRARTAAPNSAVVLTCALVAWYTMPLVMIPPGWRTVLYVLLCTTLAAIAVAMVQVVNRGG